MSISTRERRKVFEKQELEGGTLNLMIKLQLIAHLYVVELSSG